MTVRTFAIVCSLFLATVLTGTPLAGKGSSETFSTKGWLADLDQVHDEMASRYANLEWAVFTREANLPELFESTKIRIEAASSDADARAAFDRFSRKLGDGHLLFIWPHAKTRDPGVVANRCRSLGYDSSSRAGVLAAAAPGYHAIETPESSDFPAGLITTANTKIGIIKIGVFMPQGYPALCEAALTALALQTKNTCDDACNNAVNAWVISRLTAEFTGQIRALRSAGAQVLLIDIADNGGGTEWAETVARMVTPLRLKSERVNFVRGNEWANSFATDEAALRQFAKKANARDRAFLLHLTDQIEAKRKVALTPCDSGPLWRGEHPTCSWLGEGFYGSGYIADGDPAALSGKPWASLVFTPMETAYQEGIWRGPLVILINRNTGSAASEFAAVLKDNHAALLVGEPADGGCGHTLNGAPIRLKHSGAIFEMPDCARFRADGSNEITGVEPDILVGFTATDGPHARAQRFMKKLPTVMAAVHAMTFPPSR
jgi:hypothetical protein